MQRFSKLCLHHLPNKLNRPLIVSGTVDGEDSIPSQHLNNSMGIDEILELQLPFEEADMWLIPHIQWDVINFLRYSVTVISDDTDVLVLMLGTYTSKNSVEKDYKNCIRRAEGVTKECGLYSTHNVYEHCVAIL